MENEGHYKKGLWTQGEDIILQDYIKVHGKGHWNRIPKITGLKRCGKSCRLRWVNYLSPNVKRGHFSEDEDDLIIRLHKLLGNQWSLIAGRVPGRTDNQVKNHWNTNLCKRQGVKKEVPDEVVGSSSSTNDLTQVPKEASPKIPDDKTKMMGTSTNEDQAHLIGDCSFDSMWFTSPKSICDHDL